MKRQLIMLLMGSIALLSLLWTSTAAAQGAKFCFKINNVTYTDSGFGEDVWTTSGDRYLRGVRVSVRKQGASGWEWEGYVNDSNGSASTGVACTPVINSSLGHTGFWQLKVSSYGYVNGNYLQSKRRSSGAHSEIWINNYFVPSSGTFNVSVNPGSNLDIFQVYLAAAEALYTENAGLTGKSFNFKIGAQIGSQCPTCFSEQDNTIYVSSPTGDSSRKFKFIHELGHWVSVLATDGKIRGAGCTDFSFTDCPANGSHAMTSKESGRCASGEGFAHFYSAITWNSPLESNCFFRYWNGTTVNCNSGETGRPLRYMENTCNRSWDFDLDGLNDYSSWDGLGVEIDWLRVFWNMRTDACSPTTTVSSWMTYWLNTIPDFGNTLGDHLSAYDKLDAEANKPGQIYGIKACWNAVKGTHGIDHPIGFIP